MENTNENLAFIRALIDAADSADAARLLHEKASQVDGVMVESLIFLAKNYSEQGELESADYFADLAIDAASMLTDSRLLADARFVKAVGLQYGGQLVEAETYYREAADLYGRLDMKSSLSNCLGNLGLIAQDLGDISQAIEYHCLSLAITRETGDIAAQLADLTNLAAIYYSQGDYLQAEQGYEEVRELAIESGERENEMDALAGLGLIYRAQGSLERSRGHLEAALAIAREKQDQRGEASQLGNLGLVYQDLGDLNRALEFHQTSASLHAKMGNRQSQANQLGNMANVYYALGDLIASDALHLEALKLHQATGFQRGQAEELGNLALIRRIQGNFSDAIVLTQAALQIDQAIGDRRGEAADWGNLGILYTQLGADEHARQCLLKALVIDREIGYVQDELNHINNLADLEYRLGNIPATLENYAQALNRNEEIGYPAGVAHQLGNIGTVLVSIGRVKEGREYLDRALKLTSALGDRRAHAADLASLSNACVLLGETAEALEHLNDAIQYAIGARDSDLLTRALIIRGDIYRDAFQIEAAHNDYAAAIEQLEQVHTSIIEEEHQIGFFSRDKNEVYERLIHILLVKGRTSSAFDVVQQAKSRSLIKLLSRSHLVPAAKSDSPLVTQEQELMVKMDTLLILASRPTDDAERLRLSAELAGVNSQLKDIWGLLSKSSEEYVGLRQGFPLNTSDIRGLFAS